MTPAPDEQNYQPAAYFSRPTEEFGKVPQLMTAWPRGLVEARKHRNPAEANRSSGKPKWRKTPGKLGLDSQRDSSLGQAGGAQNDNNDMVLFALSVLARYDKGTLGAEKPSWRVATTGRLSTLVGKSSPRVGSIVALAMHIYSA